MSTLRNAAPRRTHLERSQPASRIRSHPLLEKHKDYALRARDHNLKKAKLKTLREKAAGRNEDEFAFGMVGSSGKGKKGSRGAGNIGGVAEEDGYGDGGRGLNGRVRKEQEAGRGLSTATVLLLKSQDAGYVRVMRDRVRKQRERLAQSLQMTDGKRDSKGAVAGQGSLHVLGADGEGQDNSDDDDYSRPLKSRGKQPDTRRHTVFVNDKIEQSNFSPTAHFNTDEQGLARIYNRPRHIDPTLNSYLEPAQQTTLTSSQFKRRAQHQLRQRRTLAALDKQERELAIAERELDAQTAKMRGNVGSSGVNKAGVKWRVKGRKR